MRRLLALVGVRSPTEARVFQGIAALAVVVAGAYWFVSYEPAGTLLLSGFAVASGIIGLLLASAGSDWQASATGARPRDPERPLLDERGRPHHPPWRRSPSGSGRQSRCCRSCSVRRRCLSGSCHSRGAPPTGFDAPAPSSTRRSLVPAP